MIEFVGYLTDSAKRRYIKKIRTMGRNILLIGILFVSVPIVGIAVALHNLWIIAICLIGIVAIFLLTSIPMSSKEYYSIAPNHIFVKGETIVCITQQYTEAKNIKDVKVVLDFGEFYELVFPFGKISDRFICQKNLATKGTLENFEALFDGKIKRV